MRTGFIGLGAMGAHMARNLHKVECSWASGIALPEKARALADELGCVAATSPAALAKDAEAIVMCVSADQDVLDVVDQIAGAVRAGTLVTRLLDGKR